MPANKYALLRYRIIHRCLSNPYRPYPTKEYLREQCEEALYGTTDGSRLSVKTIERDLRDMREDAVLGFHAPIHFSRENQGYYYEDPEFDIDRKPLSAEELDALAFAANTLYQFRDTGIFQNFSFAIEKMFEQLRLHDGEGGEMLKVVQFETVPFFRGTEYLDPIYRAIRQLKKIRISHLKFSDDTITLRTVDPYLLKEYRNRWYVIGFETGKKRIQSFGLDRIQDLTILDESYRRDPGFNPETYFRYTLGITEAGLQPEKVVLSFSPLQGKYLKTQPLHHSQEILMDTPQEFRVAIRVLITFELIQLILGYGPEVEVMEPEHLRSIAEEKITKALLRYRGKGYDK